MKSWFSIKGIREEIKKISWPGAKEMRNDTITVLGFVLFFVGYFMLTEFVLAGALRWIGV